MEEEEMKLEYLAMKEEYENLIADLTGKYEDIKAYAEMKAKEMAETKPWYASKTIWVNAVALLSVGAGYVYGYPLSPEEAVGVLAVVNLVLRVVTGKKLG